ncbi:uncharacterized protein LTR77_002898 [Saxophila tyrrhenica]|uniref:Uncharacterized protein n=1 Tax=Saxophila tyrrhenica TaxID=1690608 RepID=A0AAV9PK60_9PEZI|nr:hypothetical protein LTR77_002898 [Saxophila tyrrhenica]
MASLLKTALALPLFSALAQAAFVPAPTDLTETTGYYNQTVRYKQVPEGICELTPGVKSYSGYVDIEEHQHIFWWFFEARDVDPSTAPLTVWINGGPGSSSMIGLFQELGPCGVDSNGEVFSREYAWNNVSNMLFIDQPAQTGFSYSIPVPGYIGLSSQLVLLEEDVCPHYAHGCQTYSYPSPLYTVNSTQNAAPGMWKTLQGFMGAFPQYSRNGFHFATESYGGHYGPVFNEYIETQNALIDSGCLPNAHRIQLESVLIGNGWFDPLIQYEAFYNYTVNPGNTYGLTLPNGRVRNQMYNGMYGRGNCYDQTIQCRRSGRNDVCAKADNFCYLIVEYVLDVALGRDEYDVRELMPDPFPPTFYVDYLNTPKVQQAIGAYVNFSEGSSLGGGFSNTGDDDRLQGAVKDSKKLVDQGIYMVQFNGDADYVCNWIGNEVVAENINAPGFTSAGYANISTSDDIVHGVSKQSDNFAFVRIYEAGHEVPFYQPVVALEMFQRVINGYDVATGKTKIKQGAGFMTEGPAESTFREGNGTVQYEVVPTNATFNTTTNEPNSVGNSTRSAGKLRKRQRNWIPKPAGFKREYTAEFNGL